MTANLFSSQNRSFVTGILTCLLIALCSLAPWSHAELALTDQLSTTERTWLDQHDSISVAFDGDFPPYSFINDNGDLEGYALDVFKLLSEQTGLKLNIHPEQQWHKLYDLARSTGDNSTPIDVVATMVDREQRQEWFRFTAPYIYKSLVIIDRNEDSRITHRQDIAGKTVALVRDYQYAADVIAEFPSTKPLYVDTLLDALNAVSVGDADAAITFLGAGHFYRSKYLLTNLKYAAVYDKESANESIAVRKSAPQLVGILQKALNQIPEAKLHALRSKWLPVDYMENLIEIPLTAAERQWIKENRNIRLGIDPEFAPFEFLHQGQYQGMTSDYIRLLNQRLNLNMQVVPNINWKEAIARAERGDIDVLPAVGVTRERKSFLNYTRPYLNFHHVIVTRNDTPFVADLSDVDHSPIAVQANSSHHGFLREQTDVNFSLFATQQEALLAVSGGQASAFVGNVASATYWIRKLNLNNLKIAAPVSGDVQSLHFAIRKDWPQLQSILQKGLDSISARQRKLISEKWLSVDYDPIVDYTLAWKIGGSFSILIALVFGWNLLLNRQVRLRTSQLNYAANYNQLSGLPNRALTMDRLEQMIADAQRNNTKIALLSVDIDDFKKINDGFDHRTGDTLIKAVSRRLQRNLQETDNLGHLGADHFLVVQNSIDDASDAAMLSEKLIASLNQSFDITGNELTISASIGVSIYPDDGLSPEDLLKHANAAKHHSKNRNQGNYTFYTKNLIQNVSRRLELDRHMRGALERCEFEVYYQPKVEARSRTIVSFEALMRWNNPDLGVVSPVEFIPVAEKNGIIEEMGAFAIEEAFAQLTLWRERYNRQLSMAINLSPVQFRADDLLPKIESTLLKHGLSGRHVEFEITEGVLLSEYPDVGEKLNRLESLGVRLSMDDFGTGYSSMSYLRKYRFDSLKIDGEFINDLVRDESDQKLVAATIAMAHGLGMTVVAERIETEEQYQWLADANCDYLQGWLFSKADSAPAITKLLDQHFSQTIEGEITETADIS